MYRKILTPDVFLRVIADILLVNFSLFLAFIFQFLWTILFDPSSVASAVFSKLMFDYLDVFWLVTLVCITVFSFSGFYTHSRAYRGRFKAAVILQAVSLSFLIVGFICYLFPHFFDFSRRVLVFAFGLTLAALWMARLWSLIWRNLALKTHSAKSPSYVDERAILVIGGAGYIGSALLPKLLDAGYKVRILDLFLYGEKPIASYLNHENLEIIKADFRQIDKVVEAVKGVASVIHLGAIVGDPACSLNEALTVEVNLMATRMIAEVCKGFGVHRFIFASTCSVYGASECILDEKSKLNPVSLYAKSKIASERVLQKMADDSFAPIILRFGTVFGFSGRTRFDLVVNLLTAKACFDKKITVFGGDQWRPFVHVDDAANGIFSALRAPLANVNNEIFNVGDDDNNYTLGQVGEAIKMQVPEAELLDFGQDGDRRDYRVDFSKIRKELGFKAKWPLASGIKQVIDEINHGSISHYAHADFSNVKTLQDVLNERIMIRHIVGVTDLLNEPV